MDSEEWLPRRANSMITEAWLPHQCGQVRIRHLSPVDFDAYIALERDSDAKRYLNGPETRPEDDWRQALAGYRPSDALLIIADAASDRFIGRCGLIEDSGDAEIHIVIAAAHQKRGIASMVLPALQARAIAAGLRPVAIIHPENIGSLALMKRLGWRQVGTKKSSNYENGFLRYTP